MKKLLTSSMVVASGIAYKMDVTKFWIVLLMAMPVFSGTWREGRRDLRDSRELHDLKRMDVHHHSKRHMLPQEPEPKKRMERTTPKPAREMRKKPSGHLTPLAEDDIENDEVVSVAIGPPPIRPKYEKHKKAQQPITKPNKPQPLDTSTTAINLIREVLTHIGKEFIWRDVNENFVFGQYVGNSMRNLTNELRLSMQHEILDLIVKYQKLNSNGGKKGDTTKGVKMERTEKKLGNDTDETWPDFTNLAKIVG